MLIPDIVLPLIPLASILAGGIMICCRLLRYEKKSPSLGSDSNAYRMNAIQEYRVQLLRKECADVKREQAERNAVKIVEMLSDAESTKLELAVLDAKCGATSWQLSEKYEIMDAEAELIISLHGRQCAPTDKTVH